MLVGKKCVFDGDIWVIVSEPMIDPNQDEFMRIIVIAARGVDLMPIDIEYVTLVDKIL